MTRDDRTILRRTHEGHEPSARELWRRHAGWMLAFARTISGDRRGVSPEDIVQTVFCRLLELDRATIRAVRDVRPYMAQLTRREALNQIRSARRAAQRELGVRHERHAPAEIDRAELALAMSRLPRRLREVVHLRHIAGLSTDETALALGLPRGTVASRSHAAMRTLRDLLAPDTTPTGEPRHALAE